MKALSISLFLTGFAILISCDKNEKALKNGFIEKIEVSVIDTSSVEVSFMLNVDDYDQIDEVGYIIKDQNNNEIKRIVKYTEIWKGTYTFKIDSFERGQKALIELFLNDSDNEPYISDHMAFQTFKFTVDSVSHQNSHETYDFKVGAFTYTMQAGVFPLDSIYLYGKHLKEFSSSNNIEIIVPDSVNHSITIANIEDDRIAI